MVHMQMYNATPYRELLRYLMPEIPELSKVLQQTLICVLFDIFFNYRRSSMVIYSYIPIFQMLIYLNLGNYNVVNDIMENILSKDDCNNLIFIL